MALSLDNADGFQENKDGINMKKSPRRTVQLHRQGGINPGECANGRQAPLPGLHSRRTRRQKPTMADSRQRPARARPADEERPNQSLSCVFRLVTATDQVCRLATSFKTVHSLRRQLSSKLSGFGNGRHQAQICASLTRERRKPKSAALQLLQTCHCGRPILQA